MRKETIMLMAVLLITMASFPVVSADSVATATSDARSWNGGLADVSAYAYASDVQTFTYTNVYTIGNAEGHAYAYARNDGFWCCIIPISDSQPQAVDEQAADEMSGNQPQAVDEQAADEMSGNQPQAVDEQAADEMSGNQPQAADEQAVDEQAADEQAVDESTDEID